MIIFGPVPSRRLGTSLGINHIPPKYCPYSCIYCQVGRTTNMEIKRREFYPLDQILHEVENKIVQCFQVGSKIDYLTLVPDGEPTLDINLGKLIEELKRFDIPVAVISNAALINNFDVQNELMQADWVSMKIDAVDETLWHKINRPHRRLSLAQILSAMLTFREKYQGVLVTETMLLSGLNDNQKAALQTCDFLLKLQPHISYLSLPIRPPAETNVVCPGPQSLLEVLQVFFARIPFMDLLFETEVGNYVSTGDIVDDILSITAVHPLREEALRQMIAQAGGQWKIVEDLLYAEKLVSIYHHNERFFLRSHKRHNSEGIL